MNDIKESQNNTAEFFQDPFKWKKDVPPKYICPCIFFYLVEVDLVQLYNIPI